MSNDDASVTSVAGPSVVRERTPDIERGMVLAGRYQVEAIIGKGGSGIVLRAFDRTAQTVVAVKVLKQELVHDERWAKRFSRELRLGRPIRHPNVCRIFDIGEGDGHRFLTMELANGGTLRDLIKRGDPLRPLPERLADAAAAIAGLTAIHEAGIVHRDVKPDNMLRMDDGRLVLSDFGLATDLPTAAAVTVMVGTPHYMAPEVRAGEPATTRSDVWALGVVLYEIFFGKRPERRSSMSSEGMSKPPAPLTSTPLERAMLALCERCLVENPMERPPDAGAVGRLFESANLSPGRFVHRKQLAFATASVLLVAVVGGLAIKGFRKVRATPAPSGRVGIPEVEPTGQPADWSKHGSTIATVSGHVHCFSILDDKRARIVWGQPRRAEDVDLVSGVRHSADLLPETYAFGCPELAPSRNALLFTAQTSAGTSEIRMSKRPDGGASTSMTPGADPLWMRSGEEFLYDLDGSHPAVFSLPTMSFSLLPDPGLGGRQRISEKAVSSSSNRLAILLVNEEAKYFVAVYGGETLEHLWTYMVPAARSIHFDPRTESLFLPDNRSASSTTVTSLDWRTGVSRNLGRYAGLELLSIQRNGAAGAVLLGRQRSKDVWLYDGEQPRKLTSDGQNYSAAISRNGDLLVSKLSPNGRMAIWRQGSDGFTKQVTQGSDDVDPEFAPDGRSWSYVDYARKSIMLCSTSDQRCAVLHAEESLPVSLKFSPGGEMLAYLTQAAAPHLMVLSLKDGAARQVNPAYPQCPPVWSSARTLWDLEGSPKRYAWVERDVITGAKTGKRAKFEGNPDSSDCWSANDRPGSPFFLRLRIKTEESSQLVLLSSEEL